MQSYKYLIVGGGMCADAAVRGLRQVDAQGSIGLVGVEAHPPYDRPALSKGLWKDLPRERIWRKTEALGADLRLGRLVVKLDLRYKEAVDGQGQRYAFEKLLLATGGTPQHLAFDAPGILYYRTLDDYDRLRQLAEQGRRFAVIGGGFIGSEIAAALTMAGKEVVMVFPESAIGERSFPGPLARRLSDYYRQRGVELWAEDSLTGMTVLGKGWGVKTRKGRDARVDGVVAGVGLLPATELARSAGLTVRNGIDVDDLLRTSHPDVYAAGDAASFYNPALAKRLRVEHEDNANMMGMQAGRNMAGEEEPYQHLPYFYSDMFDLSYEAVGELDPRLEMVEDWSKPYEQGVVYYLRQGRLRGVLLWNVPGQVMAARRLMAQPQPVSPKDLLGRLPEKRPGK
jgi:3-phenylpropionate/trans-cinnamate dioxygenase ferredoxin reductase subunit